jgi:hypothetical protein
MMFDKLARRHLEDGLSDDATWEGVQRHLAALPRSFLPSEREARTRIAEIRAAGIRRPLSDAEAVAALDAALERVARAARSTDEAAPTPYRGKRKPGRPKGRTVAEKTIVETFRRLKAAADGRQPTQEDMVANLGMGSVRTLQDHLTDYGLPWPIE